MGIANRMQGSPLESIDILEKMLRLSPPERIRTAEALEHPIFTAVRNRDLEFTAEHAITLDFESESDLNETSLRECFQQLIGQFPENDHNSWEATDEKLST